MFKCIPQDRHNSFYIRRRRLDLRPNTPNSFQTYEKLSQSSKGNKTMSTYPSTLSVTECHQLLNELLVYQGTHKQFARGIRNYTLACFMLEAGLRVGEVVRLCRSDITLNGRPLNLLIIRSEISKTRQERQIPISTRLADAIKTLAEYYWTTFKTVGGFYAFYQTDDNVCLTTRQVERIISAASIRTIGRPVHPHILRHTFATKLMRLTDIRTVQTLLGHSSITSTQVYTHPDSDDLKEAIERAALDSRNNSATVPPPDLRSYVANRGNAPPA